MQKTQVFDIEDFIKMLFKSIDNRKVVIGKDNIINIHSNKSNGSIMTSDKQRVIILRLFKTLLFQLKSEFDKPLPRSLFETIKRVFKFTHQVGRTLEAGGVVI